MSEHPSEQTAQALRKLREDFLRHLPSRLNAIALLDDRAELLRKIHSLAGAGGTFGFANITTQARLLEARLQQSEVMPVLDTLPEWQSLSSVVQGIFHDPTDVDNWLPDTHEPPATQAQLLIYRHHTQTFIDWHEHFRLFKVPCQSCSDPADLTAHLQRLSAPVVVLIDLGTDAALDAELQTIISEYSKRSEISFMVMADSADFRSRLIAARAGASTFLIRPVSFVNLMELVEQLIRHKKEPAFRVLIVDDDVTVSMVHASVLRRAGMEVRVLNEEEKSEIAVQEFNPDLILLDVYMQHWSGPEIAVALRQKAELLSLPIVYLSAEEDRQKQLNLLRYGADDFLTKPIRPDHLTIAVTARIRRARELRLAMVSDGLTGALNRRALMYHLDTEIARSFRTKQVFSLALLDLDHFKQINDRYGHLTGDAVLKSLTQLTRQRLRQTDIIGRFGGEEFVVILSGTDMRAAMAIVDELRMAFFALQQYDDVTPFYASFSAGLTEWRDGDLASMLLDRADRALYQSKNDGRNRISCIRD